MDELVNSLSELIRSMSRINNNNPGALNKVDIERLERAKNICAVYADKDAPKVVLSTSLDGCPFHYCDKNPNCVDVCRYK